MFRVIKPQGLTKHLQTAVTQSLRQTINITASNDLKKWDVKQKEGNGSQDKIIWSNKCKIKYSLKPRTE